MAPLAVRPGRHRAARRSRRADPARSRHRSGTSPAPTAGSAAPRRVRFGLARVLAGRAARADAHAARPRHRLRRHAAGRGRAGVRAADVRIRPLGLELSPVAARLARAGGLPMRRRLRGRAAARATEAVDVVLGEHGGAPLRAGVGGGACSRCAIGWRRRRGHRADLRRGLARRRWPSGSARGCSGSIRSRSRTAHLDPPRATRRPSWRPARARRRARRASRGVRGGGWWPPGAPAAALMRTVDRLVIRAPLARVFAAASDVERWPALLPHYRWVRMLERRATAGWWRWRPTGRSGRSTIPPGGCRRWRSTATRRRCATATCAASRPAWTSSGGSCRGDDGTEVTIVHEWNGPRWPLIGGRRRTWVIGPVFVHGIASRTLAGIGRRGGGSRVAERARRHHRHRARSRRSAPASTRSGTGSGDAALGGAAASPASIRRRSRAASRRGERLRRRATTSRSGAPSGSTASASSASPRRGWRSPTRELDARAGGSRPRRRDDGHGARRRGVRRGAVPRVPARRARARWTRRSRSPCSPARRAATSRSSSASPAPTPPTA